MGLRVVIDQQALATGCAHWKCTVPYSNVVKRTAQTLCTGYKENIVVLKSGHLFDYLCHRNWFLLSLLIFNLFLCIFFNSRGGCHWQGAASGTKSYWQVQKVTLAGPKSHTRAKTSHWSVIMIIKSFLTHAFVSYTYFYQPYVCLVQVDYDFNGEKFELAHYDLLTVFYNKSCPKDVSTWHNTDKNVVSSIHALTLRLI